MANGIELVCLGDESIHVVNGEVVMRLADSRQESGDGWAPLSCWHIALQTEGAELFYRSIEIPPITELPARSPPIEKTRHIAELARIGHGPLVLTKPRHVATRLSNTRGVASRPADVISGKSAGPIAFLPNFSSWRW